MGRSCKKEGHRSRSHCRIWGTRSNYRGMKNIQRGKGHMRGRGCTMSRLQEQRRQHVLLGLREQPGRRRRHELLVLRTQREQPMQRGRHMLEANIACKLERSMYSWEQQQQPVDCMPSQVSRQRWPAQRRRWQGSKRK